MTEVETFIPYNQNRQYMMVEFVEMKRSEQGMFADIMVVDYKGKEYELYWDEYYSYYAGKVEDQEGFIP